MGFNLASMNALSSHCLQALQSSLPHPFGSSLVSRHFLTFSAVSVTSCFMKGFSTIVLFELWST